MNTRFQIRAGATLAALLLSAGAAAAQSAPGTGLQAWAGCWEPVLPPAGEADAPRESAIVCVVPQGDAAEVLTLENGQVARRDPLRTGERLPVDREGCTGEESLVWSADGRRLFRSAAYTCGNDVRRSGTGVMALAPTGDWLDVQGAVVGEYRDVQVARYRRIPSPQAIPDEVRTALEGRGMAVDAARMAASGSLSDAAVLEAVRRLDVEVVEAWLVEREQGFALNGDRLVALAEAGVPERVIDVMVALSYPDVFAINRTTNQARLRPDAPEDRDATRPRPVYGAGPMFFPSYGWGGGYYPGYRWGGYGGYPVTIVERPADEDSEGSGRAVKGRGYTRRRSDGGSAGSGSREPSVSRDRGESGSTRSGGSSGSSGSGRTAKPRGGG